ncbi:MAG: TetR/AcrR family transcriptional regulator [Bacteroidales bacterium]
MVKIIHQGDNAEKLESILTAAQKRFGIYGLEKTTMQEIAADLDMSKGSLYYYFPDKVELYRAVTEKEQLIFIDTINKTLGLLKDPAEMLRQYATIRLEYFRKLANLSRMRLQEFHSMKETLASIKEQFNLAELGIITGILEKGIAERQFYSENPGSDAALFLEILRGLRIMVLKAKENIIIEEDEYSLLSSKVKRFTELFIQGITIK